MELFVRLLTANDPVFENINSMHQWFAHHQRASESINDSLARAAIGGFSFRQISFAFASAYQSAMESMFTVSRDSLSALCHTEKGVKKPREMQTFLKQTDKGWELEGAKSFVSGGDQAETLLISAIDQRDAIDSANPSMVVVRVNAQRDGVNAKSLPTLPFVPELSHASLLLNSVHIGQEDILPRDGYMDYVKPFRTEEDMHILSALTAHRLRLALELNQDRICERLLSLLGSLVALQNADRRAVATNLVLNGIKSSFEAITAQQDPLLKESKPEIYAAWQRDKALLSLAETAQKVRTTRAWEQIRATQS